MSVLNRMSPHAVTRLCALTAVAAVLAVAATLAFSGCSARKVDKRRYAGLFSDAWQGKALRLEGVSSTPCVQYSTAPGGCVVYNRKADKTIEKHTGACEVEGSITGKYISLNCRNGDSPCVPGDNKIIINLNAASELEGNEAQVMDSSLSRKIVPIGGTCDQETIRLSTPF